MSRSLNKIMLIGNLGRNPDLRHSAKGTAVSTLSVATSSRRKNPQSNEWEDQTDWHKVLLLNQNARWAHETLTKGRTVYVEGAIRYGVYLNKSGFETPYTYILATHIETFGAKNRPNTESPPSQGDESSSLQDSEHRDWLEAYEGD